MLTYGVETVAGNPTWLSFARSSSFMSKKLRPGLAMDFEDGVKGVDPLFRLGRVDVRELMGDAVEDHALYRRA